MLAICVASGLAACGDSNEPALSASQREGLLEQLAAARWAAEDGDRDRVHEALNEFSANVDALADEGGIDADAAAVLLIGAEQGRRRVASDVAPTPPPHEEEIPPSPEHSEPVAPPPDDEEAEEDEGDEEDEEDEESDD